MNSSKTAEVKRLQESRARAVHWKRWGPYLSERAWGTVREDYSPGGTSWDYLPYDHARSRAYRWNEDGIAGIADRHQFICFALAFWNGQDPILKERLYGLTGEEGNHGEDVKEYYFYLDSTPTHSYMKCLYKYPQRSFPYADLYAENRRRGKMDAEYELLDTGIFDENRYFDIFVEYAKAGVEDILIRITVFNRAEEAAPLHLLPTIWYRNTWAWGHNEPRPSLHRVEDGFGASIVELDHHQYGRRWLYCNGAPPLLFTENDTNYRRIYGTDNPAPYVKDGINDFIVQGIQGAVNPGQVGTKASGHYTLNLDPGASVTVQLRLTDIMPVVQSWEPQQGPFTSFDAIFSERLSEADAFYTTIIPQNLSADARGVMRQSFGGLLWSKQFYHYAVAQWLDGDPGHPPPPLARKNGRNHDWTHLYNADVISMPDKWEYPWYATWDLAFHCFPIALVDPDFAKEQLVLMLREWYMHPNGQLPAYEWALGDVNPPVHAWAAWRVYKIEQKRRGIGDTIFLERVFHKLMLNFTWWVNRKDNNGNNLFQGGFLGLDNIGVFDRSAPLPTGGYLEQSDGTSWMAMYCLNMMTIALELARTDEAYEDVASKFWEHFVYIAYAMNHMGQENVSMWDEEDGFYYSLLYPPAGSPVPMKVRSMVGLIPLFAVDTLDPELLEGMPSFRRRLEWFIENRPDLTSNCARMNVTGKGNRRLLSIVSPDQLRRILSVLLDEREFLSPYGIRALSRIHKEQPFIFNADGAEYRVDYEPAESRSTMFGGNSNWRGPIWFPLNYLLIESLQKFHHHLGNDFQVECPTGSGRMMTLNDVAADLSRRLTRLMLRDPDGRRPVYGDNEVFQQDPHWRDHVLFYEYFHGDDGTGLGASHQTGWTGLVAKLLQQSGEASP